MEINISNLKDGEHRYDFSEPGSEFDIESLDNSREVKIGVVLYKMANQFSLDVKVAGDFIFECDRCMENFETKRVSDFNLIYKYEFSGEQSAGEIKEDNLKFISPNTHIINLKEDVRDYLLLSIPMKKVPDEINGVCTYCNRKIEDIYNIGEEDSTNPLWEQLKKLKK